MSDLLRFKEMVLAIAPRHSSGPSTFAVCTPPHPPAYTHYCWDNHTPQKDLSDEFCSLTNQIMIFNLQSEQRNQMTQHPPQFHRFGVHMHNSQDSRSKQARTGCIIENCLIESIKLLSKLCTLIFFSLLINNWHVVER